MKDNPLSNVLTKIFTGGFYKVHAGLFMFLFLVMVGAVEPSQILNYHKILMLAFITSPLMLLVVFGIWLLYAIKTWHYVAGQIGVVNQTFLFYSTTSLSRAKQLRGWMQVQFIILLPVIAYGLTAVVVGFYYRHYWVPVIILIYLVGQTLLGGWLYTQQVSRLIDGGAQSILLRWSSKWRKPYFSLFIYYVFDKMKVKYMLAKVLSYLIITAIFYLFADVSHDARVAGIAILAIITAHTVIIFELRSFEEQYLSFSRGLPYTRLKLFAGFVAVYLSLLLPEGIWLFSRFAPLLALQLLAMGLSIAVLFHGLLYWLGLDMDKYLQWILGLFMVLFWVIMFRLLPWLIAINVIAGLLLFYFNYYKTFAVAGKHD